MAARVAKSATAAADCRPPAARAVTVWGLASTVTATLRFWSMAATVPTAAATAAGAGDPTAVAGWARSWAAGGVCDAARGTCTGRMTANRSFWVLGATSVYTTWVVMEPMAWPVLRLTSCARSGYTPEGDWHWPAEVRSMVKPVVDDGEASPIWTGMDRSNPPPASTGSPLTARGEWVEEIGVPVGPDADTDWSKADTLDRQE